MKKIPPTEKLIELAKLAPKVEWRDTSPKQMKDELEANSVLEFMKILEVKGGKFEVPVQDFYNLFSNWDIDGTTYRNFRKELKKYVKFSNKERACKLNKKLITIQDKYKELMTDDSEE